MTNTMLVLAQEEGQVMVDIFNGDEVARERYLYNTHKRMWDNSTSNYERKLAIQMFPMIKKYPWVQEWLTSHNN